MIIRKHEKNLIYFEFLISCMSQEISNTVEKMCNKSRLSWNELQETNILLVSLHYSMTDIWLFLFINFD